VITLLQDQDIIRAMSGEAFGALSQCYKMASDGALEHEPISQFGTRFGFEMATRFSCIPNNGTQRTLAFCFTIIQCIRFVEPLCYPQFEVIKLSGNLRKTEFIRSVVHIGIL